MTETLRTGQVAEELGLSEPHLQQLIRRRKIPAPRAVNNRRIWTRADLAAAKRALECQR